MKVILSNLAYLKMNYYIKNIDLEISGVGLVDKLPNRDLYVMDIFLINQKVTGTETKLDPKAVHQFILEKAKDESFPIEKLRLWWHSHVDMGCFWSGTDKATMNALDLDLPEDNWFLSIVGTKNGDRLARLDVYSPFRMHVDKLDVEVGEDLELEESIKKEITEKVLVEKAVTPSHPIYGPQGQVINEKKEQTFYGGQGHAFTQEDDEEPSTVNGYDSTKSKKWNRKHGRSN